MPSPSTLSQQIPNGFAHDQLGTVCFISDLHLCAHMPQTLAQFQYFCQTIAPQFDTLIIMGDLFEYWLGDDVDSESPTALCVDHELSLLRTKHTQIGFIAGNRDFLVGKDFAQRAGMTLLPDPFVLTINQSRILLSHGDLLCTDDVTYQRFRRWAHSSWVQKVFFKMPLKYRKSLAQRLRHRSQQSWASNNPEQREYIMRIQDVNPNTVEHWFDAHRVSTIIHGHTHRPDTHAKNNTTRMVLPDWDCDDPQHYRWGYIAWMPDTAPQLRQFTAPLQADGHH